MRSSWRLAAIGVVLIIVGGIIAAMTQTDGGIQIKDVRFQGAKGNTMSALLYIPPNATTQKPAPGILAVHGYINSRETQDGFAIEFARRDYVVVALDQTGHGYSDAPAFASGFGGPDGLAYLRSLDFVDKANIGLEGHSMGGWTILAAATAMPNDYKAMVLEGSSTGKPFAADGTPTWPRNVALVFAQYEEFSKLMWGVDRAKDVPNSPKLQAFFGATGPIEPAKVYGDVDKGTARVLYTPSMTHPAEHISHEAIGYAIAWFQQTLQGGTPLPRGNQIWMRKEFGTLAAMIGFVVLLLGAFEVLLKMPAFAALGATPAPSGAAGASGGRWWTAMILSVLIPFLTYYPAVGVAGTWLPASKVLPQSITTQIAAWALINAIITFILMRFVPKMQSRGGIVVPSILIAVATVAIGYLSLEIADLAFKIDFRFWVVALKLMSAKQWLIFLIYLVPFIIFFVIALRALRQNFLQHTGSATSAYVTAICAMALGFALLCAIQYGTLFIDGKLLGVDAAAGVPLFTIIAMQFVPIMAFVAVVATFTIRRTGSSLPGALICALVVTWYIVAGQATQAAF